MHWVFTTTAAASLYHSLPHLSFLLQAISCPPAHLTRLPYFRQILTSTFFRYIDLSKLLTELDCLLPMAPILHLVRHAQGLHNVPPYDDDLIDPALTAVGEAQCNQLWKDFPFHSQLTHLAASPMQRALQTCIQSFGKDKLNTPVVALDMLQETSDAPNDTGSTVETLHTKFGDLVDLTSVSAEWMDKRKGGQFACEIDQVVHRASIARKMLHCLLKGSDGHIAAVSHGGFLHFLSDDWEGVSMQTSKFTRRHSTLVTRRIIFFGVPDFF